MNKTLSGFYDYSKLYMKQATTMIAGQTVVWPWLFGGLAQLVATLIGSTKLLYAGPG